MHTCVCESGGDLGLLPNIIIGRVAFIGVAVGVGFT
jgi:hypothetical protein